MSREQNLIFWRIFFLCVLLCYKSNFILETPIRFFFAHPVSLTSPHSSVLPQLLISARVPSARPFPAPALPLSTTSFQPVLPQNLVLFSASFPLNLPASVLLSNWTLPQTLGQQDTPSGPRATTHLTNFSPWDGARTLHRNRKPSGHPMACRRYRHGRRHAAVPQRVTREGGADGSRSRSGYFPPERERMRSGALKFYVG